MQSSPIAGLLTITSFIIHYLGWQVPQQTPGHLLEMETISSIGWLPRNRQCHSLPPAHLSELIPQMNLSLRVTCHSGVSCRSRSKQRLCGRERSFHNRRTTNSYCATNQEGQVQTPALDPVSAYSINWNLRGPMGFARIREARHWNRYTTQ